MKQIFCLLLLLPLLSFASFCAAEAVSPREALIDTYLSTAYQYYKLAGGQLQRAHYARDPYVCKNFTKLVFHEHTRAFTLADYPTVTLYVPDNLPAEKCVPAAYGVAWKNDSASQGNPFVVAASFRYDDTQPLADNLRMAREFFQQVQRGDFLQMSAQYTYGVGAHSLIFTMDYDPESALLTWCDSNMDGKRINDIRYGYVQYNARQPITFFMEAVCHPSRGATLYRLREDIIYKAGKEPAAASGQASGLPAAPTIAPAATASVSAVVSAMPTTIPAQTPVPSGTATGSFTNPIVFR